MGMCLAYARDLSLEFAQTLSPISDKISFGLNFIIIFYNQHGVEIKTKRNRSILMPSSYLNVNIGDM